MFVPHKPLCLWNKNGFLIDLINYVTFLSVYRCNEGKNQSASWKPADSSHCNRRRVLHKELQNDLELPPSQDLPCTPCPLPLPQSIPLLEKHLAKVIGSNGQSNLSGRGLGQGLGPRHGGPRQGTTLGQCRGLGARDCGPSLGRNPLVQELSELEGQIQVIKQQLQSAMRRKRELEQFRSEHQQTKQTGPSQSTPTPVYPVPPADNQHTNTLPEF